jgi:hypothetical protein
MSDKETGGRPGEFLRPEPRNRKRVLTALGVVGSLCVLAGIGLAVAGGTHGGVGEDLATPTTTAPNAAVESTFRVEPTVTPVPAAREGSSSPRSSPSVGSSPVKRSGIPADLAAAPNTVTTYSGSGNQATPVFTTTAAWQLAYSFNCSAFGTPAIAEVVEIEGAHSSRILVHARVLEAKGNARVHGDPGPHYLKMVSPCSWVVKVVDQP